MLDIKSVTHSVLTEQPRHPHEQHLYDLRLALSHPRLFSQILYSCSLTTPRAAYGMLLEGLPYLMGNLRCLVYCFHTLTLQSSSQRRVMLPKTSLEMAMD